MDRDLLKELLIELFPLNRSITGEGYRKSLEILKRHLPFEYIDIQSGSKVFDWVVPEEWEVRNAYILNLSGVKILDYRENNLHVVNYSAPVNKEVNLKELKQHLNTIPELPEAIPYVTSYYKKQWGFCMSHQQKEQLEEGKYKVVIDSHFRKGKIRIGEYLLPGKSKKEILLTSYLCHPSMANNELGGPLCLLYLYHKLSSIKNRHFSYRFVINPETIGSIAYLSQRLPELKKNVIGGLVLNCLGGPNQKLSYKASKYGNSVLDKFFLRKNRQEQMDYRCFTPFGGSDERQYNSPGVVLPVGQIARTIYQEHKEYHNSLDDLNFIDISQLEKSCSEIFNYIREIEELRIYKTQKAHGEPFLSRHNLYPSMNSNITRLEASGDDLKDGKRRQETIMHILSYSDGENSLKDISEMLSENLEYVTAIAELLEEKELIKLL